MQSELEKALSNIIDVYHNYSTIKGNHHAVYRDDFKKMVTTECPQYVKNKNIENLFKEFDVNSDNAVNFEEFLVMTIRVGVAAHKDSHKE
ncbi:protein S100-A8 [Arvicanthis niloticus]|uniref:protein S100-A8 n=1 Tax=Arvicanthis niloticus TaxID=61156 RepID=UPI001486006E|nr:protein S100-A8 [Arvicanthis niloticus]